MTATETLEIPETQTPQPAEPPTLGDRWAWARDFGLIGAVSGFLAPYLVVELWLGLAYPIVCGLAGGASGAWLGYQLPGWLERMRDVPTGLQIAFAPALGAVWGALVGAFGGLALLPHLDMVGMSIFFASIAAAAQFSWLWLTYALCRKHRIPVLPVVVGACLMPVLGAVALRFLSLW